MEKNTSDFTYSLFRNPSLIEAVQTGDIGRVEYLISNGSKVNRKNKFGGTALQYASGLGNRKLVKILISYDADTNSKNEHGYTVLMDAAEAGHLDIVKLLVENGANANECDDEGDTALSLVMKTLKRLDDSEEIYKYFQIKMYLSKYMVQTKLENEVLIHR